MSRKLVIPDSPENFGIEDNESQDRDDDSEDNSGVVYVIPGIENNKCLKRRKSLKNLI